MLEYQTNNTEKKIFSFRKYLGRFLPIYTPTPTEKPTQYLPLSTESHKKKKS